MPRTFIHQVDPERPLWSSLSGQQQTIMVLMKDGLSQAGAGASLGVVAGTINWNVKQIYIKVKANNMAHAMALLLEEKFRAQMKQVEARHNLAVTEEVNRVRRASSTVY